MAVTITPLGFQKPDGNESIRNGDNIISANADRAEGEHQSARGRLGTIEAKNVAQDGRLNAAESSITTTVSRVAAVEAATTTQGPRLAALESNDAAQDTHLTEVDGRNAALSARIGQAEANIAAGAGGDGLGLSEDPDNPGTYFMADTTTSGPLQADPVTPGLYTF